MKIRFDTSKQQRPDYDGGLKVPYAPAKRAASAWKWYAVVIITASPLIFFLVKIILSYILVSAPGMVFLDKTAVVSPETGTVKKLYVKPGDSVAQGMALAVIETPDAGEKIAELTGRLEELGRRTSDPVKLEKLKEGLALSESVKASQSEYLGRVRYLFMKGAATSAELNLARSQYDQAKLEWDRQKEAYDEARTEIRDMESHSERKRVAKDLERWRQKNKGAVMTASVAGVALRVLVTESQVVEKGAQLFTLAVQDSFSIKAYIRPSHIGRVKKGRKVTVKFPGGRLIPARIAADPETAKPIPIELSESFYESKQSVEVQVSPLEPLPHEYRVDGLPVDVYFGFL
jgi:multidrug resistance efflux pump